MAIHESWLVGKTVASVDLRHFDNGRGGKATDPVIRFTDGSYIFFSTIETEHSDYGTEIVYVSAQSQANRRAHDQRRRT
jgi:hypothetical protein